MAATAHAAPPIEDGAVTAEQVLAIAQLDATDAPGITGATVHTAVSVLRLRVGDQVVAFEGRAIRDAIGLAHVLDVLSGEHYIYIEIVRAGTPRLIRLTVTGDIDQVRAAQREATNDKLTATITAVDATHFTIAAAMRDQLFADPAPAMHSARIVPAVKDGKPHGFKLYAIRPSSLPAQLGISNGDTVLTVNGVELTADNLPATLAALAQATTATVTIERRGQLLTLTYTVK